MAANDNKNTAPSGDTSAGPAPSQGVATGTTPTKKVEVDESILLGLQKTIADLQKNQEKLMAVADKNRLAQYDQRTHQALTQTAKMSFFDGKPVMAWRSVKDDVYVSNGVYHEVQTVELIFDDGSTKQMTLLDQARQVVKQSGEIISRTKDFDGNETVKLLLKDGREFTLDIKFLN